MSTCVVFSRSASFVLLVCAKASEGGRGSGYPLALYTSHGFMVLRGFAGSEALGCPGMLFGGCLLLLGVRWTISATS